MKRMMLSAQTVIAVFLIPTWGLGQSSAVPDPLRQGFASPPSEARPRVWWHWMNGNISKEGILLDEEWMKRVGIAGFQNFDAALSTPLMVKSRISYMTPEWKDAFKFATVTADRLGLEMAIAGSPGWSETGGPWVPPSEGMKKYVWAETEITGGGHFTGLLKHPPTVTGAFQDLPVHDTMAAPPGSKPLPQFYKDGLVIAYKRAAEDTPLESLHPRMTASGGAPNAEILSDGKLLATTKLPIPDAVGGTSWIQWEFPAVVTVRAITVVTPSLDPFAFFSGLAEPTKTLEASDDGQTFRAVVDLDAQGATEVVSNAPQRTISFPAAHAKFFRVVFKRPPPPPIPAWAIGLDFASLGIPKPAPVSDYEIAELSLHSGARVNHFEDKAAFVPTADLYGFATAMADATAVVSKSDVIDLTGKMSSDGTLDWDVPPGNWVVVRFGYSLLGITNHPAPAEATGLEVDKLNRTFVRNYMTKYLDTYKESVGPEFMGKKGIRYIVTDSWEAGSQNWTDNMLEEFKMRRGYDATPWLPVLTGQVVQSSEASDRFLWDFRKTISDLIAEEHYGQVQASINERGMGHYGESHEDGRTFVADGMEVKKLDEVPMGAMWTQYPGVNEEQFNYNADDRESASVAHIYGQNVAAAESMTAAAAPWAWSPSTLKPTADQEFLNGINRFAIHESAHQPLVGPHTSPGITLGPFGQWFNRNETWAEQAGPWIEYLSRSSFLLQQGHFGADLVYFYGEDSNLTAIFHKKSPKIPVGYGFDYINADGLIHELGVSDGRLATKSGMSYALLALDPYSKHMSLPVLRSIYRLVQQGATVAGLKPIDDPSLADDASEFRRISDELFGDGSGQHAVGKGRVFAGQDLSEVLAAMHVEPDFSYSPPASESKLEFVHRKLSDGDVYFVDNRGDSAVAVEATFRVHGRVPEIWHAEDAKIEAVSFETTNDKTRIPLRLEPWGAVFVVFRTKTTDASRSLPNPVERQISVLDGPWTLSFQPDMGTPASISIDQLSSWSESPDPGVRYFSGTGTYTKTIQISAGELRSSAQVWLDLGEVKNLAEVEINGKPLGEVWHFPFRVNVTGALKAGANEVEIKVQNAWVNRMIGDQQKTATTKYTSADVTPYHENSPLLPSGLLGPVRLLSESIAP